MRNILNVFVVFLCLTTVITSMAFAQNLQVITASASLTDVDNNGYANVGDRINFQVYADGLTGPGGIGDSIFVGVIFTYYSTTDTVYLTKNTSSGTSGGGYGNDVYFSLASNSIAAKTTNGLNGVNVSGAASPAAGALRFFLFKKIQLPITASAGAKQIIQTTDAILVSDGSSSTTFNNIVDNVQPTVPTTTLLTVTDNSPTAFRAGVGDVINLSVDTAGTGGVSKVFAYFTSSTNRNNTGYQATDPMILQSYQVGSTNYGITSTQRGFELSGTTIYTGSFPLRRGVSTANSGFDVGPNGTNLGLNYYLIDAAGNVGGPWSFPTISKAIDNRVFDLASTISGTDTLTNAVVDSLTDFTTDGIATGGANTEAYIIGTKVVFKYTEPSAGSVQSVTMNLAAFGGSSATPLTYTYQTAGRKVFLSTLQTLPATNTDAALNTIKPLVALVDSAGNVFNVNADFSASVNPSRVVDLIAPGNFTVSLSLNQESTVPNAIANGGEQIKVDFAGLNANAGGYRFLANNNRVNTTLTGTQRDLNAGTFPVTGNIDGGSLVPVTTSGLASANFNLATYTPSSSPAGLNIAANDPSGTITFIVRDHCGNERTATATIPFAVNNINPAQPAFATLALVDMNGNNKANIGDSIRITISGSGADAGLTAVYVRIQSNLFGAVGQQSYSAVDRFGSNLGDDAGTGSRPDYVRVPKVGNNFVFTFPVINDPNAEFTGTTSSAGSFTLRYHVIDGSGNNTSGAVLGLANLFTTSALTQSFDNSIPTASAVLSNVQLTTSNANAAPGFASQYISVGSTITITYPNVPADIDTVWADLRMFGLTANEAIQKASLGVISNATKIINVTAYSGTGVYDVSSALDSARIPITVRDQSNNSVTASTGTVSSFSSNAGTTILAVDRVAPVNVNQSKMTFLHTDNNGDAWVDPSDNNGIINVGERIRILIDVSSQPDVATFAGGTGYISIDLSAFGLGVQQINGNSTAPAPGTNGYGYDASAKAFVIDQVVQNNGVEQSAGSIGVVVRNIVDNSGAQTNPGNLSAQYVNLTIAQRLDALIPTITIPVNSLAFSAFTDVNGDGIAGIGDGIQVNADVVGADSVFADLRSIGRGFTPMVKGSGNSYSIASITVQGAFDPQWASDNKIANTTITIIAQDNTGNRSTATTVALSVDNLVTKAPYVSASPTTSGRIVLRIDDGPVSPIQATTLSFNTDMSGGTVPGTSLYQVYYDSTGTGTFVSGGTIPYAGASTSYTSIPFSDGRTVSYKVTPFDHAGNQGTQSLVASATARTTPSPAVTYEPANGTIIGTSTINLRAIIDTSRIKLVTGVLFRARPVDIDSITAGNQSGGWFTVGAASQAGDVWSFGSTAANFTSSAAVGYVYQVIAVVTDIAGNTQTDDQALATNGSIIIYADAISPDVKMVAINDSTFGGIDPTPPPAFVDVKARGMTTFTYIIKDNLPLNQATARLQVEIDNNLGGGFITLIGYQTVADLIAANYLSVNTSTSSYTLRLDMTPYVGLNPTIRLTVQDGRGNSSASVSQRFSVDDKIAPAFYLREPFPSTSFRGNLRIVLSATGMGNSSSMSEAIIQLSSTVNFASLVHIGTVTQAGLTILPIPSGVSLTDGAQYYIRAIVKDGNGNTITTDPNLVVYTASAPTLSVSWPQEILVNGDKRITGTSKLIVIPSTSNVASIQVRSRRIDQDATSLPTNVVMTATQAPFELLYNTGTNYSGYEGLVVFELTVADIAGNTFPPSYITTFVDNKAPSFRITSVNGSTQISSFSTMAAGDTMTVTVEVLESDVATGQFFINGFSASGGPQNIRGLVQRSGKIFTVRFPLLSSPSNNIVNMDPTSGAATKIVVMFVDSVGNTPGTYVGPTSGGTPPIGSITVIGNQNPSVYFSSIQRGFLLKGSVALITKTMGMSNIGGKVRFELKKPGSSVFEALATINTEPFQTTLNTASYADGLYVLRAVPIAQNNIEWSADTVSVIFDNKNNGTTERAAIVDFGGARIGGNSMTFRATAGIDVGAVQFWARFVSGINGSGVATPGWFPLGSSNVRNNDGTFTLSLTASEIATAYGFGAGAISSLDGEQEFAAIAEDRSGYQYYILNNPGATPQIPFGTGNADDGMKVATTRATVDVTAPNGIFAFRGAPLTTIQAQNFSSATALNFNLHFGIDTVSISVTAGNSDFGVADVTLKRLTARKPGGGNIINNYGDQVGEGAEKVVASFTNLSSIQYIINANNFIRGSLYELRVYLRDNLGNSRTLQIYQFMCGYPQAYIAGYNQEHKTLLLLSQSHAASAKVEYSTDNGTTYQLASIVPMSQFGTSGLLDAASNGSVSVQNITLPVGNVLFKVTGSERDAANYAQSRFNSAPTIFGLTIAGNGTWTPQNLSSTAIGLVLNKQYGALNAIRPEVLPENSGDQVSLVTVLDQPSNVTTNQLSLNFLPRDVLDFGGTQVFQGIDGGRLGLTTQLDASNIQSGGTFQVFASNVRSNGTVDMNVQSLSVERITALRGDTVTSSNGNFSIRFDAMTLTGNTGVFIEEDQAKFRSYAANQLDIGQIGSAYWISGLSGSLRSGLRANVLMRFSANDIVDANSDGIVDGRDKLLLNVATVSGTSFNFSGDIKDKFIDTINNTIAFSISTLSLNRYTLVLDNAATSQQGSIVVNDLRVGNIRSNNFTSATGANFLAIVGDNISGLRNGTEMLFIDGIRVNLTQATVVGAYNSVRYSASLNNLNLSEGSHIGRFVVENMNGNRYDRTFTFYIDQMTPRFIHQTAFIGRLNNQTISFTLSDPSSTTVLASGIDTLTVSVDVFGTKAVKNDSSEVAYEIQQFIARLNPSQLAFSGRLDSLSVSFTVVDNLALANIDGYELVVHDGTTPLSIVVNNGSSAIMSYGTKGIWDLAGNQSLPINFRVAQDVTGPMLTLVSSKIEENGIVLKIVDDLSGVDTNSIRIIEIDADTKDSTISTIANTDVLTFSDSTLIYKPKKAGDAITITVSDIFANTSELKIFVESAQAFAVTDFHIYPNPFNPQVRNATISFSLSRRCEVTIEAFDWLGRSAGRIIEAQTFDPGRPSNLYFTGRLPNGSLLANGVYFLKMIVRDGENVSTSIFKAVVAAK